MQNASWRSFVSSRWRPRGGNTPVSASLDSSLELQPTKQFESSRSWTDNPCCKGFFQPTGGFTYNISWHSHHQSRVLEELHCNASDAKPGVASFGNWCGLVLPKGTRQYEAQGLVHELPPTKQKHKKKRFGFGVVHPSNLLICLLLCGVFHFLCYLLSTLTFRLVMFIWGMLSPGKTQRHLCGLGPLGGSCWRGDLKVMWLENSVESLKNASSLNGI